MRQLLLQPQLIRFTLPLLAACWLRGLGAELR
jgi:hypothetical protein